MSKDTPAPRPNVDGFQLPSWLAVFVVAGIMGFAWWQNNFPGTTVPDANSESSAVVEPTSRTSAASSENMTFQITNQTIRDLKGHVVFKGTIDLKPTLDRIERGELNRHHNDGTPFQNREGRLPRKSHGYYKEYVHPTPGDSGPGPQRIIIGKEGDIWYTPDHYKTFLRIEPATE